MLGLHIIARFPNPLFSKRSEIGEPDLVNRRLLWRKELRTEIYCSLLSAPLPFLAPLEMGKALPEGDYGISLLSLEDHQTPRIALSVRSFVTEKYRIIDSCIIHTCFRIKDNRCMYHTYMHQDQGCASYIHASVSRIIGLCIIHTCIKIKDHRCMHHTYMHQDQGS